MVGFSNGRLDNARLHVLHSNMSDDTSLRPLLEALYQNAVRGDLSHVLVA